MAAKYPSYAAKAVFVELMVEDADVPDGPATHDQLDAWITSRKIAFPMTIDKPETPFLAKKTLGPRETAYVVELSTMKVLLRTPDFTLALDKLDTL